jgi:HK97 family phage major capsid protein
MKKPTPKEVEQLRTLFPKGAPRIDYRAIPLDMQRARADDGDGDEGASAVAGGADGDVGTATGAGADDPLAPIPIAISSEAPVLRYDWWDDEYYYEVLDHSAKSVVLDYSVDGLPFVASHRSYDADQQHGIVEDIAVGKDRVLRGDMRPSRAQRSQEIAQDMRDKIRKKVSVGYIVGDEYTQVATKGSDIPTRRYTAWMPIEVSTVPVPADYSVGVDRAQAAEGQFALSRFLQLVPPKAPPADGVRSETPITQASKAEERTMETNAAAPAVGTTNTGTAGNAGVDPAAPAARAVSAITVGPEQAAIDRINNITAMAGQHACTERLTTWIKEGTTELEVARQINGILAERMEKPIVTNRGPEFKPEEARKFSLARALMIGNTLENEVRQQPSLKIDLGYEREVLQEMTRHAPPQNQGQVMPLSMLRACLTMKQREQMVRAGIDSGTSTTGQPFKFTQPGEFIPILRNKTSVMRAGSTVLSGLTGPVTFPKQTSAAGVTWSAENPGSDNAVTNLLTTTVTLSFKSIMAGTAFSRQMLFSAASGNYDMEAIIQSDIAAVIGVGIDLAGLNGLGSSNQPKGVLKNTSIGSVALGTNGGTMSWGSWVDLETKIGQANATTSRMAYITNSAQRGTAKKSAVLGNTASGVPIWTGASGDDFDGQANGYRAIASEQVPGNLTKGTSTTVCSAIVFGAWEHNLIGMFGPGFETIVDPYSKKYQGMIEVAAWSYVDVAQRYDGAFAAVLDAL